MSRRSPRIFLFAGLVVLAGGLLSTSAAAADGVAPPSISISFDTQAIQMVNGWSTLTFTISNPNSDTELTGVTVTDTVSAGIIFANPDSLTGSCGPGSYFSTAVSTITLVDGSIPAGGSCTFKYDVLGVAGGPQTSTTNAVTSNESAPGNTATAHLFVALAPTTTAVFADASIPYGGSTTLTFTVTNPNPGGLEDARPAALSVFTWTLSGIGFHDALPAGLVVSTPNGFTGDCGGGSVTATAGSGSVTLAGASLGPGASCTFAVNVTGITQGVKQDSTGPVASLEGGPGDPAIASLGVGVPPPAPTPPASTTVDRNGSGSGGAPALPFIWLLVAIGLFATVAVTRLAKTRV
jgi:uncharacterized repeat protein (TIGR01451 family)